MFIKKPHLAGQVQEDARTVDCCLLAQEREDACTTVLALEPKRGTGVEMDEKEVIQVHIELKMGNLAAVLFDKKEEGKFRNNTPSTEKKKKKKKREKIPTEMMSEAARASTSRVC